MESLDYTSESSGLAIGEIIEPTLLESPIDPANNDKVETLFQKPKIPDMKKERDCFLTVECWLKTREQSFSHEITDIRWTYSSGEMLISCMFGNFQQGEVKEQENKEKNIKWRVIRYKS